MVSGGGGLAHLPWRAGPAAERRGPRAGNGAAPRPCGAWRVGLGCAAASALSGARPRGEPRERRRARGFGGAVAGLGGLLPRWASAISPRRPAKRRPGLMLHKTGGCCGSRGCSLSLPPPRESRPLAVPGLGGGGLGRAEPRLCGGCEQV